MVLKILALVVAFHVALIAHTGVTTTSGFVPGFAHPLGGLDHLLAMVAVGVWAAMLGGRALWVVPTAFVVMMTGGAVLGFMGIELLFVEGGIVASVIVIGLLISANVNVSTLVGSVVVAFFALFHGFAHGAEMPLESSALTYMVGFSIATALLHGAGMVTTVLLFKFNGMKLARFGGGIVAASGLVLALM